MLRFTKCKRSDNHELFGGGGGETAVVLLTSQSRRESIAKRSLPWRSWNLTISSAAYNEKNMALTNVVNYI